MVSSGVTEQRIEMNYGNSFAVACLLQQRYLRTEQERPVAHSIERTPDRWAFTFFVAENNADGSLLACSDFRVEAEASTGWAPRMTALTPEGHSPERREWTNKVIREFLTEAEGLPGHGETPENLVFSLLPQLIESVPPVHAGSTIVIRALEANTVNVEFVHSHVDISVHTEAGRGRWLWFCSFHGAGVVDTSAPCLSKTEVSAAVSSIVKKAIAYRKQSKGTWCCDAWRTAS